MLRRLFVIGLMGLWAWQGSPSRAENKIEQLPDIPAASPPKAVESPQRPVEAPPPAAELAPLPCPAACPAFVEKSVCQRKVVVVEEQCATTIPKMTVREIEVERGIQTKLDIEWKETPFVCHEVVLKPRQVEQDVVCTVMEPCTTVDPCTGCERKDFRPVQVVKKVTITVLDVVPEDKAYILRTPCLKRVDNPIVVKKLTVDCTTEPGIEKRFRAINLPCEQHLQVPACTPPCPHP